MNKQIKKIAIVGPESTGKSTMSQQLAKHYNVPWVPEYARYYCAALTTDCTLQDEINMFHGQIALEESVLAMADTDFIICDTTFVTVKIWSDEMLGETPQIVLDALKTRPYDFYLLLDIDLPWQEDPLRDFPHMREHFMKIWHKELKALNATYKEIGGIENRLQNAINAINNFLKE
ncbi:AAA family ATPase [Pedobacter sp. LMG 31464]|uniref:AAA family ATPase n=1 Tax=Pedobacter planticolens TaxID=2679964 RepID=A0A923DYJ2_9SPHI|nr:AAA family ATPase [Pedobacter planticolens]MBB2146406.1 AAA family ATPase [Pedobacter planticolens]